jgi:hypothetical protein
MSNTDEGTHLCRDTSTWLLTTLSISTGNGVTELLAACDFNSVANGVGPFSFTHALISQLRKLAHVPSFTVGYLYNLPFTEIQGWRLEDSWNKKAPVHLVIIQDHRLPRSITLSARRPPLQPGSQKLRPLFQEVDGRIFADSNASIAQQSATSGSPSGSNASTSPFNSDVASSTTSAFPFPEYHRLLFSVIITENIKPGELSTEVYTDWLGTLPIAAKSIRVGADSLAIQHWSCSQCRLHSGVSAQIPCLDHAWSH